MRLRTYQKKAILAAQPYLKNFLGNPVIAMPTGTGKSLVIGGLIRLTLLSPKRRVLVLAHVKELLTQNLTQALLFDPSLDTGVYSAGLGRRETNAAVIFAGIASVYKRVAELGCFDLVLIDECHLVSDDDTTMYQTFLQALKKINPNLKIIGLSATPWRTTSGLLTEGKLFSSTCYDLTGIKEYNQLVADGYIAPLVARAMDAEFDTGSVKMRGGDFVPGALQKTVDNSELTRLAVAEMVARSEQRKHWLVFATGIEHSEHVANAINAHGVAASFVHSKITTSERDDRIDAFKNGELVALVNNNVLTTGFDFPGIDLIGMLRPTMSPGLWVQMLGRGTRPDTGKVDCLVLDFAGNTMRLGPINNVRIPHASEREKGEGKAPVKKCDKCLTINNAAARFCCSCGEEFPRRPYITAKPAGIDVVDKGESKLANVTVDDVNYTRHEKKGGIPSLKVTYQCGFKFYREWICFEHSGYARHRAEIWWCEHCGDVIPDTVDEALAAIAMLHKPVEITVDKAGRYACVVAHKFVE